MHIRNKADTLGAKAVIDHALVDAVFKDKQEGDAAKKEAIRQSRIKLQRKINEKQRMEKLILEQAKA
jgi:hypothetical protein